MRYLSISHIYFSLLLEYFFHFLNKKQVKKLIEDLISKSNFELELIFTFCF